jgi:hypothetical protein
MTVESTLIMNVQTLNESVIFGGKDAQRECKGTKSPESLENTGFSEFENLF